jgi:Diiron non-heme beta-hydroxylase N-terminal domain
MCGRCATGRERKALVELSRSIDQLDAMLRTRANGYSLEGLYAEVPPCLQGFVEIVYDLNNQPSFRLIVLRPGFETPG